MRRFLRIFGLAWLGACAGDVTGDPDAGGFSVRDAALSTESLKPDAQGGARDAGEGAGAEAGAVASGLWRPFNDESPWNTPIPVAPKIAPDSAALIDDFRRSSAFGEHLDINIAQFSVPLYFAKADTPRVEVVCDLGGLGFMSSDGSNARAMVPIPTGARPDPGSDRHLSIVDAERKTEWGMWNVAFENGKWKCGVGATADLTGPGLRPYKPDTPKWYTAHGPRACGFPLIAGLIRVDEIEAGHIDHALALAYPHIRAGFYMSPASTGQARIGDDAISTRGIPCGGRVQLDPDLDLDSLGLSPAAKVVAEALQRYGAFVADYSGALSLYAENSPEAQQRLKGVLDTYDFEGKLDLGRLRVLAFGKLTDDGNGN